MYFDQVKGVSYSLEHFLGPLNQRNGEYASAVKQNKNEVRTIGYFNVLFPIIIQNRDFHFNYSFQETELYQCVIYLAPGDYHRFHSPTDWKPTMRRHFHGELLSVNPKIAQWLPGLFCLNERAVYTGQWKYGFYSFTAVGKRFHFTF